METINRKFCELTGARGIWKIWRQDICYKSSLPKYLEPEIVIVTEILSFDEQAVLEAMLFRGPCNRLSNSDNITSKVDLQYHQIIGRKALATVYWL
ncbi:MAG: hypothetical protein P0116_03225 [Candidatus Nitrosocosmicus sp.]|nr:hypothetical protein [Candidatus Nitrosocosmicus sp.]